MQEKKLTVPFRSMFSSYETPWNSLDFNTAYFPDLILSVNFPYFQLFPPKIKFRCTAAHQIQRHDMNAEISSFLYCDNGHVIYCHHT